MTFFYYFSRLIFKLYFKLFYRLKVSGIENNIPGKAIIASSHTSFLDPPVIATCWPEEISFLARKSLFDSPILGPIIRRLNAFPVAGTMQDIGSFRVICRLLDEGKKVVIFPEGVRSSDGKLTPFKSGIGMLSTRCMAPIIPIYLHGCYEVWHRNQRFPKPWGKITCKIGSPIYPQTYAHLEKKKAHQAIAEQLKSSFQSLKQQVEKNDEPPTRTD